MCARYETLTKKILDHFKARTAENITESAKWGEIRPTDTALLIGYDREVLARRWGLMPDWAERPVINAKAEEAHAKRTFQPLLAARCVIPADAYYEWRSDGARKLKMRIAGAEPLAFAGMYTDDTFVMFTTAAAPSVAPIHHRMPAILDADAIEAWLNPDAEYDELRPLLAPWKRPLTATDTSPPPRQGSLF
jgi:putative SOS response-associated peptidase YedK